MYLPYGRTKLYRPPEGPLTAREPDAASADTAAPEPRPRSPLQESGPRPQDMATVLCVERSQDGEWLAALTPTTVYVWSARQHRVVLGHYPRTQSSLRSDGHAPRARARVRARAHTHSRARRRAPSQQKAQLQPVRRRPGYLRYLRGSAQRD